MLNVPVAWFRAEDYEHIRQISGRGMPPTFTEWEAQMMRMLARSAAAGIVGEKVIIHRMNFWRTPGGFMRARSITRCAASSPP